MFKTLIRYLSPTIRLDYNNRTLGGRTEKDTPYDVSAELVMEDIEYLIDEYIDEKTNTIPKILIDFVHVRHSPSSNFLDELAKRLANTMLDVKVNSLLFKYINIFFKHTSLKEEFLMYYKKYKNLK